MTAGRRRPAKKAKALAVPIGAAFAVPIDEARVGVCRVIAPHPELATAVLIAATRWVGSRAALSGALSDPRVGDLLRLTHHSWRDQPCIGWAETPPPPEFLPLGTHAPTASEQRLRHQAALVWLSLPLQYRAQLDWEADPDLVRARDRQRAKDRDAAEARERALPRVRATVPARRVSLAMLARRAPFADWSEPLRARARERIRTLIAALRERDRDAAADLRRITRTARSFNREREIGTLEAEALDEVLLAIACAVDIDIAAYETAIDAARDW